MKGTENKKDIWVNYNALAANCDKLESQFVQDR